MTVTKRSPTRGFLTRTYTDKRGKDHAYVLFVPHASKPDSLSPILVFLHGAGERQGGKKAPVEVGLGPAIRKREKSFPFFALIPQCGPSPHDWNANGPDAQRALAMLEAVMSTYAIDPDRVYLTGLSMGGFGTWSLAARYPGRWAAIAPVCGGGDPTTAAKIKDIPCWAFHGARDDIVPPERSRVMIAAVRAAGGDPKYTEYAGVEHNSWDRAYGTKELYSWLLEHRLRTRPIHHP